MEINLLLFFALLTFCPSEVTSQDDVMLSSTTETGVQEVIVPMCKGLVPYTHTRLPNSFNHSTQVEVHRIIEHLWAVMDAGCSRNFRLLVCSLYLPPYNFETNTTAVPCRKTCMLARNKCRRTMTPNGGSWPRQLRCRNLPKKKKDRTCISHLSEKRRDTFIPPTYCSRNPISTCQGLPESLALGTLPNFFLQRNTSELEIEMQFYNPLLNSGCHANLDFFLCGTLMPFCVSPYNPFSIPCREFCVEIERDCKPFYNIAYQGLPWPNKLQCHRYPLAEGPGPCIMPGDYLPPVNPVPDTF